MSKYFEMLTDCQLFSGISPAEIERALSCLGASVRQYAKDAAILKEGDPAEYIGIVLSGSVRIMRTDIFGNRSILAKAGPMDVFGEALACADTAVMPVDVVAAEETSAVLISAARIAKTCANACVFHSRMIVNLLHIVASKNIMMNRKLEVTSKRSTRDKLLTYLMIQAKMAGGDTFTIPFDRQELADYLEVDRSGLSAEISRLRREGIIENYRSDFTILKGD